MGDFFNTILSPLTVGEAWVMLAWHKLWTLLGIGGGWAWALSIVGLTVVVRIVLIPLFVKQIHASRKMQLIQPEIQKIQAKYKGKTDPESRQAMTQETMDLYKKSGTNPLSSCLPILLQSPFFFALFTVLNNLKGIAEGKHAPIGPITPEIAQQIETSNIFGAPFSSSFMNSTDLATKIVTVVLIVLMSATTFTTQRQLMRKNLPASAMDNPYMKQQNIILYLMPLFFALSGINFPIGVLLYWLTTNLWSMGQQFYVIRRMPAPGSEAERALHERQARKGKAVTPFSIPGFDRDGKGAADGDGAAGAGSGAGADGAGVSDAPVTRQRQQPKSAKRAKKTAAPKP
ncbi:membrane protein insertase YidC, partial [Gordonia sp. (in: high G+C Gram-positive bacteria)]|uniref:membrane protein insertase YidC n=1 Tax=Gordonia sp. (in: high G+C Gram-positive bacteria) TaxID=84139 RepID=UPI003BB581F5